MRRSKLEKAKSRKERGSFLLLQHSMIRGDEWARLSAQAVKLLVDIAGQYNGSNNGDLTVVWSVMNRRGWKSKQTLYRALDELISGGWIMMARQGGKHLPSLYAISWQPVNECAGKLDIAPTATATATWKKSGAPITVPH